MNIRLTFWRSDDEVLLVLHNRKHVSVTSNFCTWKNAFLLHFSPCFLRTLFSKHFFCISKLNFWLHEEKSKDKRCQNVDVNSEKLRKTGSIAEKKSYSSFVINLLILFKLMQKIIKLFSCPTFNIIKWVLDEYLLTVVWQFII